MAAPTGPGVLSFLRWSAETQRHKRLPCRCSCSGRAHLVQALTPFGDTRVASAVAGTERDERGRTDVRLATIREGDSTAAVRVDGDRATAIAGVTDVGALLADPAWRARAESAGGATY